MKRNSMVCALALIASTVALHAQTGTSCSNDTLKGTWGVFINGTRPAPSVLPAFGLYFPGTIEQVAGLALQTFDGNGNFTQTDNVKGSLSGILPDRPGSGTYSVNPDCTGTFTLIPGPGAPPIVNRFIIVDGGKEFRAVVTSPQVVMVAANGRKLN
jgi:hypothetical protein